MKLQYTFTYYMYNIYIEEGTEGLLIFLMKMTEIGCLHLQFSGERGSMIKAITFLMQAVTWMGISAQKIGLGIIQRRVFM